MSYRLVPKSMTLNDLERRKGRCIALFHWIWYTWYTCVLTHNRDDLCRNLCTSLLYFLVRVRCKVSSRSLSHLLMYFLVFRSYTHSTSLVMAFSSSHHHCLQCAFTNWIHTHHVTCNIDRGATTAEKLRGTKVWVALAPRARSKAGLGVGCGRRSSLPLWGSGVSLPENLWKLRC